MKGQELCDAYLAEFRRTSGDGRADESRADYRDGWCYIHLARKTGDGSWRRRGCPIPWRCGEVNARLKTLRGRVDYETKKSRLAKEECRVVELGMFSIEVCRKWDRELDVYYVESRIPSQRFMEIQDMRDLRDVLAQIVEVAEELEDG